MYVLDAVAPSGTGCAEALGPAVTKCGDITAFQIDQSTGRLTLLVNAQVSSATGTALPYFPVPANPIDIALTGSTHVHAVGHAGYRGRSLPVRVSAARPDSSRISQNSPQPIGATQGTAIVAAGSGTIYVLDNEPLTIQAGDSRNFAPGTYLSQILPFTPGTGGALQAQTGGAVPDDPNQDVPTHLVSETKGKWVYLTNHGSGTSGTVSRSGIVGYVIDPSSHQLTPMSLSPFPSGSGPECLLEDPSNQFFYTANFNDSTVTGKILDVNSGTLSELKVKGAPVIQARGSSSLVRGERTYQLGILAWQFPVRTFAFADLTGKILNYNLDTPPGLRKPARSIESKLGIADERCA